MKRFELIITDDGDKVNFDGINDGFDALELIALFELKKEDLKDQFRRYETFSRTAKTDTGETIEIKEKT